MSVQIPLKSVRCNLWTNLVLPLPELVGRNFKGHTYQSVELIAVGTVCKLRKIFSLRHLPPGLDRPTTHPLTRDHSPAREPIPKACDFAQGTECTTLLFELDEVNVDRDPAC